MTDADTPVGNLLGYFCVDGIQGWSRAVGAMVITDRSIIFVNRIPLWGSYGGAYYLGPGSNLTDSKKAKFVGLACKLIDRKDREDRVVNKDDILRISYKKRGMLDGHVVLKTEEGELAVRIRGLALGMTAWPEDIRRLMLTLLQFAPNSLYNEETGNLIAEDLKNGKDYL